MAQAPPITAEQLLGIDDGRHLFELIEGRLFVMDPGGGQHGATAMRSGILLGSWIEERALGVTFAAETGFIIKRNPDTVRAPDFAFISAERAPEEVPRMFPGMVPDFLVEVISQNDTPRKVHEKARMWIEAGVGEAWVLDPKHRTATVHLPDREPVTLDAEDEIAPGGVLEGFSCGVRRLFP